MVMQEIKKLLNLPKQNYYETHLSIINCIIPDRKITLKSGLEVNQRLTPMEIKVLASFMSLEGDIAQYRFGPTAKKVVMKDLELKPAGLSNYMTILKEKGFLIEGKDEEDRPNGLIHILPILLPEREQQLYMFKLVNSN